MNSTILFDPMLPLTVLLIATLIAAVGIAVAIWRGLSGWALRALAAIVILAALSGPVWQQEERENLSDIAIMIVDQTASQQLANRAQKTEDAASALAKRITDLPNTELRRVDLKDGVSDTGTLAMTAIANALGEEPSSRISGIFLISDGRVHDLDARHGKGCNWLWSGSS